MGEAISDALGYSVDWVLTWATVTGIGTVALFCGAVVSALLVYRGLRNDQLYRFSAEHQERGYMERFWLVDMLTRGYRLASLPGEVFVLRETNEGLVRVTMFTANVPPDDGFTEAMRDATLNLFGPGYAADGMTSDLVAYRVLISRLAFWTGASSAWKSRFLLESRARLLLRVMGTPLLDSMRYHVRLVSRIGTVETVNVANGVITAQVVSPAYLEPYGLKDESYLRLARALAKQAGVGEFRSGMAVSSASLLEAIDQVPADAIVLAAALN